MFRTVSSFTQLSKKTCVQPSRNSLGSGTFPFYHPNLRRHRSSRRSPLRFAVRFICLEARLSFRHDHRAKSPCVSPRSRSGNSPFCPRGRLFGRESLETNVVSPKDPTPAQACALIYAKATAVDDEVSIRESIRLATAAYASCVSEAIEKASYT